jgi:hypothetical protein
MPNLAFREKTIKDTELEKIHLYKLEPPTELGTEYVLVKTSRIHNPRFPEKDFYNIMYAKSSPEGDAKSDFKLYKYIESEKSGLSTEDLRNRYAGMEREDIYSDYEKYSKIYDENPTGFINYLNAKKKELVNPDERDELNLIISIMTDISSGKREPQRLENPDVNTAISNLFRAIGDGYSISTHKPKRKDIFGLGEWLRISRKAKKVIKENSKILFMISEIGKLDIDPEGQVPSQKPKETPAQKLKRFSGLDLGEPEEQTKPAPSTPAVSKRFRNLEIEEPSGKGTVSSELSAKPGEQALDHITKKENESGKGTFEVLYAGDKNGNPTSYKDCYFCILAFKDGLRMHHLGGGQYYYYLLIVDGKIKEYTQFQGEGGEEYYRPNFPLSSDVGKRAFEYIKNKNLPIAKDLISNMERWNGNIPVNRYQPNQSAPLYQRIENKSDPNRPIEKPIVITGTEEIVNKLSLPYKKGGLGAGSYLEVIHKRPSEHVENKKSIKDYAREINLLRKEIYQRERTLELNPPSPSDSESDIRFIKNLKDYIQQKQKEIKDKFEKAVKDGFSQKEIEDYIRNPKSEVVKDEDKYTYIWHDLGLRLIKNQFTEDPEKATTRTRSKIDIEDISTKAPSVEISLDDDIL